MIKFDLIDISDVVGHNYSVNSWTWTH